VINSRLWGPVLVAGLLGCAQQDGPLRQAHIDSFCHDSRSGGTTPEGLTKCLDYYAQQTGLAPPDLGSYAYTPPPPPLPQSYPSAPPVSPPVQGRTEVALSRSGGILTVPVVINGAIRIGFVIDSGATDVTIPSDVMLTLIRSGTVTDDDLLGKQTYTLANGSTVLSTTFRIRSLRVGDRVLQNVTASVLTRKYRLISFGWLSRGGMLRWHDRSSDCRLSPTLWVNSDAGRGLPRSACEIASAPTSSCFGSTASVSKPSPNG
jgi:hypothetical protein